jgi:hypothetical protein
MFFKYITQNSGDKSANRQSLKAKTYWAASHKYMLQLPHPQSHISSCIFVLNMLDTRFIVKEYKGRNPITVRKSEQTCLCRDVHRNSDTRPSNNGMSRLPRRIAERIVRHPVHPAIYASNVRVDTTHPHACWRGNSGVI